MQHAGPITVAWSAAVAIPNLLVQAAVQADSNIAAWGVFATTVCGGIGYLIKTWSDGKARTNDINRLREDANEARNDAAEARNAAAELKARVKELENQHIKDMEWVKDVVAYQNKKIDRSKGKIHDLAGKVNVLEAVATGSTDAIPVTDTGEFAPMPMPEPPSEP